MCPQCAQALSATDKFCRHCGFAMVSVQTPVESSRPHKAGSAGLAVWHKLLLGFVALLVVLAVGTWLVMRDSASKVFKTPAHQPTLSDAPFSLDGSKGGGTSTEMASSTEPSAQQSAVPQAAEMAVPVVEEKAQPAAPQTRPEPAAPGPQKHLSGDRALIY